MLRVTVPCCKQNDRPKHSGTHFPGWAGFGHKLPLGPSSFSLWACLRIFRFCWLCWSLCSLAARAVSPIAALGPALGLDSHYIHTVQHIDLLKCSVETFTNRNIEFRFIQKNAVGVFRLKITLSWEKTHTCVHMCPWNVPHISRILPVPLFSDFEVNIFQHLGTKMWQGDFWKLFFI